jgi:hypothetical protein
MVDQATTSSMSKSMRPIVIAHLDLQGHLARKVQRVHKVNRVRRGLSGRKVRLVQSEPQVLREILGLREILVRLDHQVHKD